MKTNIGILTFSIGESGNIPLSNLVDIAYQLSKDLYLITGNAGYTFFKDDERIHAYNIRHEMGATTFTRILKYIYAQLKISYKLLKITRDVDIWIFFIGGDTLVFPMLAAKVLRRKVILASAGNSTEVLRCVKDNMYKPLGILLKINYRLSDKIIIY